MAKTYYITYEPDNSLKKGYLVLVKEVFSELYANRWLTLQLMRRDFLGIYKQSALGLIWALLVPLASIATFVLLNRSGIFSAGIINAPYPIYAIVGVAQWQIFSAGLLNASSSLVNAGSMVTKINFSKKSLVLASLSQPFFFFIVQFSAALILMGLYSFHPHTFVFLIPLFVIPIMLLTLGLGFLVSLVNAVVRDAGSIMIVFMTFGMFLTPILYAKPDYGLLATITTYNPMYYLIQAPRELILTGKTTLLQPYFVSFGLSLIIFFVCLMAFHLTETRVAERV